MLFKTERLRAVFQFYFLEVKVKGLRCVKKKQKNPTTLPVMLSDYWHHTVE